MTCTLQYYQLEGELTFNISYKRSWCRRISFEYFYHTYVDVYSESDIYYGKANRVNIEVQKINISSEEIEKLEDCSKIST